MWVNSHGHKNISFLIKTNTFHTGQVQAFTKNIWAVIKMIKSAVIFHYRIFLLQRWILTAATTITLLKNIQKLSPSATLITTYGFKPIADLHLDLGQDHKSYC